MRDHLEPARRWDYPARAGSRSGERFQRGRIRAVSVQNSEVS
jgi:hypothetical protein